MHSWKVIGGFGDEFTADAGGMVAPAGDAASG
jgi:hypothetical protein